MRGVGCGKDARVGLSVVFLGMLRTDLPPASNCRRPAGLPALNKVRHEVSITVLGSVLWTLDGPELIVVVQDLLADTDLRSVFEGVAF